MSRRVFGSVKQRSVGSLWYVRVTFKYRTMCRVAGPTRAIAQKRLAEIEKLIWEGMDIRDAFDRVIGRKGGEGLTFAAAVKTYLARYARVELKPTSYDDYRRRLEVLKDNPWATRPMRSVLPRDMEIWKERRLGEGVAVSTVNRDLATISSVWGWAKRTGQVADNPLLGVQRYSEAGRARDVRLSAEETRALIEACPPVIKPIVVCAVHTGMRRGEILSLTWDAIDFERKVITIYAEHSKNHESRVVPLNEELRTMFQDLLRLRGQKPVPAKAPVFLTKAGVPVSERVLYAAFQKAIAACEKIPAAKKEALRFHDLRHTVGSLLGDAGVSAFKIKALLGHKSIQTTQRYVNLSSEANRDTVNLLAGMLSPGPSTAKGEADRPAPTE